MYKSTINSILKITILGLAILVITGCGSPKPSDIQVFKKPEKTEKITLFNQEFDMPEPIEVIARLYPSSHLEGKMGDSWYEIIGQEREINRKTFCFNETSSRRFQTPYYALKFPSMTIKNILVYHTEEAYNDKKEHIKINPYLYEVKDKENMKSAYIFNRADLYDINQLKKYKALNDDIMIDSLNLNLGRAITKLFIAFDNSVL